MKRMFSLALASLAISSLATIGAAQAQTIGTATTDLNIRSGPGPDQPVIGLIRNRQSVNILGCVEGSLWCQVEFGGMQGWAYSRYMALNAGGRSILITEPANVRSVPIVRGPGVAIARGQRIVETTGAAPVVTSGALIGPGEAIAGAVTALLAPPAAVGSYITANPGDPITLEGDVVIGAGLPQTVTLNRVPDYRYQYVYVNDTPVLVDPATRRIVYVFR